MEGYVLVARLLKPYGLKGEIKAAIFTSFPEERFQKGKTYTLKDGRTLVLRNIKVHGDTYIFLFEGINTPEDVFEYRNEELYLPKEECPLPDGYYRLEELKGFKVLTEDQEELGEVTGFLQSTRVPNMIVTLKDGKRIYIPFLIPEFVREVKTGEKQIIIYLMPGLL